MSPILQLADFLLPWYVDDEVDLNTEHEAYRDERLVPFLVWHRAQELLNPSIFSLLKYWM